MTEVVPTGQSDLEVIRAMLRDAGLPIDGLMAVATALFVARDGDRIVGAVALERHGEDGLLRSLVVEPERRDMGLGAALLGAAEGEASRLGLGAVYLLTETASRFFAGRGYDRIDRAHAPQAIMESVEWSVACGDSAVPMRKRLRGG